MAPALQREFAGLVKRERTKLLVDLSDVTFIDSSAIGVLLQTVRQLRRRHGRLVVLCPDSTMRGLFEILGHNLLFPVDETLDDALRHLRGRRSIRAEPA